MEGQGLWETISSTESKGGPEYQRQGTEEGESDFQLFSFPCLIFFLKNHTGLHNGIEKRVSVQFDYREFILRNAVHT